MMLYNGLRVEGYFPRLQYKNNFIESGMISVRESGGPYSVRRVRLTNLKKNGAVNLSLDAQAKDDNVSTTLDWGNNAAATYSGKVSGCCTNSCVQAGEKPLLKAMVDVKPTDVILNDTLWQIHPSQVVVDSGRGGCE